MDMAFLVEKLGLTVRCGGDRLDREVSGGYVGDLLSNVMAGSKSGDVWVTCQAHQNIVAVSVLKEHAGIILSDQIPIGELLGRLERLLQRVSADEMRNSLRYLQAFKD